MHFEYSGHVQHLESSSSPYYRTYKSFFYITASTYFYDHLPVNLLLFHCGNNIRIFVIKHNNKVLLA